MDSLFHEHFNDVGSPFKDPILLEAKLKKAHAMLLLTEG